MSNPAQVTWCWLALLMAAGCASGPHQHAEEETAEWEDDLLSTGYVSPALVLAPPASSVPERQTAASRSARGPGRASAPAAANRGAGLATPDWGFSEPGQTWIPLQRWSQATGAASLTRLTSSGQPTYALQGSQGIFVLRAGTLLAQYDGLEVRLGFAPQLIDDQPYAHTLDLQKTILPLLNGGPNPGLSGPVVIDAGHGGEDAGALGLMEGYHEKDLTLDWALRLQRSLAAKGLSVVLTRATDVNLALSNRVAFAGAAGAGAFISLHFNSAAPNQTEAGLETYCVTPAGMPSSLTRGYPDELGQAYPNNFFDAQNLQLAVLIHRALLQLNEHQDRGVRRARFLTVLRGQQCPAVLLEGGYLSNPAEAQRIADPAYRQRLADAVARAVEAFATGGQR